VVKTLLLRFSRRC